MSGSACLDTNVVIWGVKRQSTPSQGHMIDRTRRFLLNQKKKNIRLYVPSVVLAELLLPLTLDEREPFVRMMQEDFIIEPFDARASHYMTELWQAKRGVVAMPRPLMKYDCLVVATALACKAECIYSDDPDIKAIGNGFIPVLDIPVADVQESFAS